MCCDYAIGLRTCFCACVASCLDLETNPRRAPQTRETGDVRSRTCNNARGTETCKTQYRNVTACRGPLRGPGEFARQIAVSSRRGLPGFISADSRQMPSKIYSGVSARTLRATSMKCRTDTRDSRFYCQINNLHPADLLCVCVIKLYASLIPVYLSPQSLLWSQLKCLIQLHRRILHLYISVILNSSVRKFNHSPV